MGISVSNYQLEVLINIFFLHFVFVWPGNGMLKEKLGCNYYSTILKNECNFPHPSM